MALLWPFRRAFSSPDLSDAHTRAGTEDCVLLAPWFGKSQVQKPEGFHASSRNVLSQGNPYSRGDLVCIALEGVMRVGLNHVFDYIPARYIKDILSKDITVV